MIAMRFDLGTTFAATLVAALLAGCTGDLTEENGFEDTSESTLTAGPAKLVRKGSGKCLDVNESGTANGTNIQQWTCNGSAAQTFTLDDRGNGVYRLRHAGSGKCVDVSGAGTADGTNVQLWDCNTSGAQKFKIQSAGSGYSKLVNTRSNKCVDVSEGASTDGANVQILSCDGSEAQAWKIQDAGGNTPPPGTDPPPSSEPTVWKRANLTNYTSYPAPDSEECREYNGCTWAGQFAFVEGKQTEDWVRQHNIIAIHERDAGRYKLKTFRLRQGSHTIDAKVYDECSDSDCDGCCTQNANAHGTGFLIDIEKYTMQRFGSGDGIVEWSCVDCSN
jgi:Ricin-type beta-trefoil lectin domain